MYYLKPSPGRCLAPGREKGWAREGTVPCCFPKWSHSINFCPPCALYKSTTPMLSICPHRGVAQACLWLRHRGLCSLGRRTDRWLTYILLDSIIFRADVITWAEMNLTAAQTSILPNQVSQMVCPPSRLPGLAQELVTCSLQGRDRPRCL